MNDQQPPQNWEQTLSNLAREYPYPVTPDIAGGVRQRLSPSPPATAPRRAPSWAVALAVVLAMLLLGVLAVPQTRAAVVELFYRIGAIRVFVGEPTPAPIVTAEPTPADDDLSQIPQLAHAFLAVLPGKPLTPAELDELAGLTVRVPPADSPFGPPDAIVVHPVMGSQMVTFIWDDPAQPVQPRLTLSQMGIGELAFKWAGAEQIEIVSVRNAPALWINGPHRLQFPVDGSNAQPVIASSVLLWDADGITFRLEGDIALENALALAEALMAQPLSSED